MNTYFTVVYVSLWVLNINIYLKSKEINKCIGSRVIQTASRKREKRFREETNIKWTELGTWTANSYSLSGNK